MPLNRLEHFLILSEDMEATKDFYCDVLDLEVGDRPPFPFPGYWLYIGETPCVHLARRNAGQGQRDYLGDPAADTERTGAIDHVAFNASGLAGVLERLTAKGLDFTRRTVPETGAHQLFFKDPNGITVELNFTAEEAVG